VWYKYTLKEKLLYHSLCFECEIQLSPLLYRGYLQDPQWMPSFRIYRMRPYIYCHTHLNEI
jgi:hypothetical protein